MHPPAPPHLRAARCTLGSLTVALFGVWGCGGLGRGLRAEWSGPSTALCCDYYEHKSSSRGMMGGLFLDRVSPPNCSVVLEPTAYRRAACAFLTQWLVFILGTCARQDKANRCKTRDRRTRAGEYRRHHTSAPCLIGLLGWALAVLGAGVACPLLPVSRLTKH
jgi:hypothetical protein